MRLKKTVSGAALLFSAACTAQTESILPTTEISPVETIDCPAFLGSVSIVDAEAKTFRIDQLLSTNELCPEADAKPEALIFAQKKDYLETSETLDTLEMGDTFAVTCLDAVRQIVGVRAGEVSGIVTFGSPVHKQITDGIGDVALCELY